MENNPRYQVRFERSWILEDLSTFRSSFDLTAFRSTLRGNALF